MLICVHYLYVSLALMIVINEFLTQAQVTNRLPAVIARPKPNPVHPVEDVPLPILLPPNYLLHLQKAAEGAVLSNTLNISCKTTGHW